MDGVTPPGMAGEVRGLVPGIRGGGVTVAGEGVIK